MQTLNRTFAPPTAIALAVLALVMAGCASTAPEAPSAAAAEAAPEAPAPKPGTPPIANAPAPAAGVAELYVVLPPTGRIHAFGDLKNYADFLAHGEVALTRTAVGAGPGGKTIVYGITGDDVKNAAPSAAEKLLAANSPEPGLFYGEVFRDGRFFLFGSRKDMTDFAAFGEVPYSYTEVGAGPKGETLVLVMNKDSYAKGRPADRLARFRALRGQ
jgi:pyruvate/2-oxoglutarate dehydrogenase complex dihydrolipoamide acyltransferase (E2) component